MILLPSRESIAKYLTEGEKMFRGNVVERNKSQGLCVMQVLFNCHVFAYVLHLERSLQHTNAQKYCFVGFSCLALFNVDVL